jgi:hypothetical protein
MAAWRAIELQAPDCHLDVPGWWQVNQADHDSPIEDGGRVVLEIGTELENGTAGAV